MRSTLIVLLFLANSPAPVVAQSALDGPLAASDSPKPATQFHAKAKSKKPHHSSARPATVPIDAVGANPSAPTAAPASKAGPDDPFSLGMKWQGNNDSAAQTRYQNLDGNAFGSGAEVGMKLHF